MNDLDNQFISFNGKIHLIETDKALSDIAHQLMSVKKFGFDTETKPSFKKGEVYKVSLLQLASESDAYLFRLHKISQFQVLKNIFENQDVLKVGVAIRDDIKQLQKIFQFKANNFIELQDIAKDKGLENFGLKGMTEEVLNMNLSKVQKLTNWEAYELTDSQMMYAATDAWIGLQLYNKLNN